MNCKHPYCKGKAQLIVVSEREHKVVKETKKTIEVNRRGKHRDADYFYFECEECGAQIGRGTKGVLFKHMV
jgi:hypothetical protein